MQARTLMMLILVPAFAGCGGLTNRIKADIERASEITEACTQPLANASKETQYHQAMNDLIAAHLGLGLSFAEDGKRPDLKSVPNLLNKAQHDFSAILRYQAKGPATKSALEALQKDFADVQAKFTEVRKSLASAVKSGRSVSRISMRSLLNDYYKIVLAASAEAHGELAQLESGVTKLANDHEALRKALEQEANDSLQSAEVKAFSTDVTELATVVTAIWNFMDDALKTGKFVLRKDGKPLDEKELEGVILNYVRALEDYEVARLTLMLMERLSRSIEYKLDKLDEKTWFAVSFVEWGISDKVARAVSNEFRKHKDLFEQIDSPNQSGKQDYIDRPLMLKGRTHTLIDGFLLAACERLHADPRAVPSNTIRADELLRPIYEGFVYAYREAHTERANAGDAGQSGASTAAVKELDAKFNIKFKSLHGANDQHLNELRDARNSAFSVTY